MARDPRRVYAPNLDDEPHRPPSGRGLANGYVLVAIALAALAAFFWMLYGAGPSHVAAPDGPYKVAGPGGEDGGVEDRAVYDVIEGRAGGESVAPRPGPEAPMTMAELIERTAEPPPPASEAPTEAGATAPDAATRDPEAATRAGPGPSGAFLAQIAALRSEEAARALWARLGQIHPDLFKAARLDVQRAETGPDGVYYRVRAGYFQERAAAAGFCDALKAKGQDCIVVGQ